MSITSGKAQSSMFPHPYYDAESEQGKASIDKVGERKELEGICSKQQYRQIVDARRSVTWSGTVASDDEVEFPMFLIWFVRLLNSTSFTNQNGESVLISTVQVPDEEYERYGTTVSKLDLRNEPLFDILSYCTEASGYVRYYIRTICKPFLAPGATTRNKLNALNVIGWTQVDTQAVRDLITPLLTDPNEKVRKEADFTLFALFPESQPKDPWDSKG